MQCVWQSRYSGIRRENGREMNAGICPAGGSPRCRQVKWQVVPIMGKQVRWMQAGRNH